MLLLVLNISEICVECSYLAIRVPVVPGAGRVTVPAVLEAIEQDTCLVTIMMANNETGVLQPVGEVFKALRERTPATLVPPLLHTDAAQAVGKVPVKVDQLYADLITVAGHKFYGPRVGALYHRKGVAVTPKLYGGGQEVRRAGTVLKNILGRIKARH